jgi:putative membrane protein
MDVGWGWWMFGSVMMLSFWGLVAWAIVSLVRVQEPRSSNTAPDSPREIADRRFAAGEIDADEHRRIVEQLERPGRR